MWPDKGTLIALWDLPAVNLLQKSWPWLSKWQSSQVVKVDLNEKKAEYQLYMFIAVDIV